MSEPRRLSVSERKGKTVNVSERDFRHLEAIDNVAVRRLNDSTVEIKADKYVGVIGLPSGDILDIKPKVPINLLYVLAYVDRLDDELVGGSGAGLTEGDSFVEAVARLYLYEIETILKQGLHRKYLVQHSTERHLQGQLDLQTQIQKRGLTATKFECVYDELSHDVLINKILIDGLDRLRPLVGDSELRSDMNRNFGRLRQWLDHERLVPSVFDAVRLTRLNNHYSNAMELAALIFNRLSIEEIGGFDRQFDSLLVNMETTFENLVYKLMTQVVDQEMYKVEDGKFGDLVEAEDGTTLLSMTPDFYIRNRSNSEIVYVGDAKWKDKDEPLRDDLYQIAAYQAKYGTPGMLVYPDLEGSIEDTYTFDTGEGRAAGRRELRTVELSTSNVRSYDEYELAIENDIRRQLPDFLINSPVESVATQTTA